MEKQVVSGKGYLNQTRLTSDYIVDYVVIFGCCFWYIVYVMTTGITTKFLNPNKNKISKIFAQDTTVVKNEYSKY